MGRCQPSLTECNSVQTTDAPCGDNKQLKYPGVCERAMWILIGNWQQKGSRKTDSKMEFLSCLPRCQDWLLLISVTPMLRAAQIRSGTLCDRCLPWRSVPGMSGAAGANTKENREKQLKQKNRGERREDIWHKNGEVQRKDSWPQAFCWSDVTQRHDEIYFVMFLSDSNQFGQKVTLQV